MPFPVFRVRDPRISREQTPQDLVAAEFSHPAFFSFRSLPPPPCTRVFDCQRCQTVCVRARAHASVQTHVREKATHERYSHYSIVQQARVAVERENEFSDLVFFSWNGWF